MSNDAPAGSPPAEAQRDRWAFIDRPLVRGTLGMGPAVAVVLALLPVLPGPARAGILTVGYFLAPGALLWWALRGPLTRNILALPAVAFAGSMVVLIPGSLAFLFVGAGAAQVGWSTVVILAILGGLASARPLPLMESPRRVWWVALPVVAVAMAAIFRAGDFDQITHVSLINLIRDSGRYPELNPFLIGDVPLSPRWRVNGWTGWLGILSHLSDVSGGPLVEVVLTPFTIVLGASATFFFAAYLKGVRFAATAVVLAAVVLPILVVLPTSMVQTRLWLSSAAQDKAVGFLVLLPIVMVLVMRLLDRPSVRGAVGAAVVFVALFLVHPLMFAWAALLAGAYLTVDAIMTRTFAWRSVLWLAVAVLPAGVLGVGVNLTSPAFGFSARHVEATEIAVPRRVGPITIWEPLKLEGIDYPPTPDAETFYVQRRFGYLGGAPARFMMVGGIIMPSYRLLLMPMHIAIALACLLVCVRASPGRFRTWIVASTALALSPYVFPPAAAVFGRLATPWVVWRFIWLLPLPFVAAWLVRRAARRHLLEGVAAVALVAVLATAFATDPWGGEAPFRTQPVARQLSDRSGVLMAKISAARWAVMEGTELRTIAGPTLQGPNNFPRERLPEARQRELAVLNFYRDRVPPEEKEEILETYGVTHVLAKQDEARKLLEQGLSLIDPEPLRQNFLLYRVGPSGSG